MERRKQKLLLLLLEFDTCCSADCVRKIHGVQILDRQCYGQRFVSILLAVCGKAA